MTMDERMTVCNMSIEGGARVGYVNPDETTFAYLRGREFAPAGRRVGPRRRVVASDGLRSPTRAYDDVVRFDARGIAPTVTWGINPGQSVGVERPIPADVSATSATSPRRWTYMDFEAGAADRGHADRRGLHRLVHQRPPLRPARGGAQSLAGRHVAPHVQALVVPGLAGGRARGRSAKGCDEIFRDAGFEWRDAGCSMCLAMNPDKLVGREICASSSQSQLQGPPGQPDRPHAADEPGHGRRRRDRRRGRRRPHLAEDPGQPSGPVLTGVR